MPFVGQARAGLRNHDYKRNASYRATCGIRLNDPCAAVMRPYVKILRPLVVFKFKHILGYCYSRPKSYSSVNGFVVRFQLGLEEASLHPRSKGDAENARPENDGQRKLENARVENDGQKLRGLENAGLKND